MTLLEGLPASLELIPPSPEGPDDPLRDEKRAAFLVWRRAVMEYRVRRHLDLINHPDLRKFELAYCANSPAYFAAMWMNVVEPRERMGGSGQLPFIPFDKQASLWDEFRNVVLKSQDENADATWSKARGWGASWWGVLIGYWGWLFSHRWKPAQPWSVLYLSRKEIFVDSPQSISLFWKIRELIRATPAWMLPQGFDTSLKGPHMQRMYIANPENGNELLGESTNGDAGRGSRVTWAFIDEAAAMEEDTLSSIWTTLAGTTDHRLAVSTESFRNGTYWYDLRTGKNTEFRPRAITADWWENPLNDDAWLERERKRFGSDTDVFEWEVLRNPWAGNQVPWVYPAAQGIGLDETVLPRVGRPTYIAIDPSAADPTALVLAQENTIGGVDFISTYSNQRQPAEFYVPLLKPVIFDSVDKDWRHMHFLDWTSTTGEMQTFHYEKDELDFARMVDATGGKVVWVGDTHGDKIEGITADSVYQRWGRYGVHVNASRIGVKDMGAYEKQARTHSGRQEAVRERLAKWRFGPDAVMVLKALQSYRFQQSDKPTTVATRKPLHDNSSHIATACEYLAVYLRRKGAIDKREYQKPVHNRLHGLSRGQRGLDRTLVRT